MGKEGHQEVKESLKESAQKVVRVSEISSRLSLVMPFRCFLLEPDKIAIIPIDY